MPELPEIETIRRQLEPRLPGKVIDSVRVLDARITRPEGSPTALVRALAGHRITAVGRRGKYLLLRLDDGNTLVLHLRMTGRLTFSDDCGHPDRRHWDHLRMAIAFQGGTCLIFQDQRRFGTAMVLTASREEEYWRRLGPEPLERSFNAGKLAGILKGHRAPIKSFLLDQKRIAGIGNIYADEALYRAHIHPLRPAESLNAQEISRLSKTIKSTLRDGIRLQGSSIDTYRDAGGRRGRFQETFGVHRREGEKCPCGATVKKIRAGGRGTYFCPACQKM